MKPLYYIGLDTGKNTGVAIWDAHNKCFLQLSTMPIHQAIELVKTYHFRYGDQVKVRFEDARLRKWFGKSGREQLQGAGSIKRDAIIWEDFLKDMKIPFEAVAPKNNTTKVKGSDFKNIVKVVTRTSVHARDAAFLVFGF